MKYKKGGIKMILACTILGSICLALVFIAVLENFADNKKRPSSF